jgi:hypothetical protein
MIRTCLKNALEGENQFQRGCDDKEIAISGVHEASRWTHSFALSWIDLIHLVAERWFTTLDQIIEIPTNLPEHFQFIFPIVS